MVSRLLCAASLIMRMSSMYLVYNMMRFVSSRGLMCMCSSDCRSISAMSPEMGEPVSLSL